MLDPASAESVRQRFLAVDTATVSDILDRQGERGQVLSTAVAPLFPALGKVAGWAYTIRGQMAPFEGSGDPDKMAAIDGLGSGEVAVWSGDGEGVCYFGELLALGMKVRGCVGAIVNGGARDTRWIEKHGFPVYARFRTPLQAVGRWKVTGFQTPVTMPGAAVKLVTVNPGDFVLADIDGVVVVPSGLVDQVLKEAEALTEREIAIRTEIDSGAELDAVLKRYGHV